MPLQSIITGAAILAAMSTYVAAWCWYWMRRAEEASKDALVLCDMARAAADVAQADLAEQVACSRHWIAEYRKVADRKQPRDPVTKRFVKRGEK